MPNTNKWDANDIPDQKGRIAIVTGSSSGPIFPTIARSPETEMIILSQMAIAARKR